MKIKGFMIKNDNLNENIDILLMRRAFAIIKPMDSTH
jgi:hypothetical protein